MTSIENVKVAFIRKKYGNPKMTLKDWVDLPGHVYIGRQGVVFVPGEEPGSKVRYPPTASRWANPFKIENGQTREGVIKKYRKYIRQRLQDPKDKEITWERLEELRGKTLGCWCHPEGCHGDVLIELLEEMEGEERGKK